MKASSVIFLVLGLTACGPGARQDPNGGNGGGGGVDAAGAVGPEQCDDAVDNDADGATDCSDIDCSGVGNCPVCGSVENPETQPLALPDGVNQGDPCTMDSQCGGTAPNCIVNAGLPGGGECHGSYTSTLNFIGFPQGATLDDPSKLLKVCATIEHSWLRDLQFELITPDNKVFILDKWFDRETAEEVYLGNANDSDNAATPVPGTGMDYCWTATAMYEMVDSTSGALAPTYTTMGFGTKLLSSGDYKSSSPWSALTGTPLNGMWTMRVTDLWAIDNGFMFNWSISFDPSLVADCSGPIIL